MTIITFQIDIDNESGGGLIHEAGRKKIEMVLVVFLVSCDNWKGTKHSWKEKLIAQ